MPNHILRKIWPVALGLGVWLFHGVSATAQKSPFALQETQARQLAIRILKSLQPIEVWIERNASSSQTQSPGQRFVQVTGSRVNLRNRPGTESKVLTVARQGEFYEYISTEGDWYLIRIDDARQAYISSQFSRLTAAEKRATSESRKERLDPKYTARVRQILGQNKNAVESLKRIARNSQRKFDNRYKGKDVPGEDMEFWAATTSLLKIRKYEQGAVGQFNRFYGIVGGELKVPRAATGMTRSRNVRGTARAGFGSNTTETTQSGNQVSKADVTRSDIAADVTADISPADRLGINVGRSEEIQFAEIARTRAKLSYQRQLGEKARILTRVGLNKYQDKNNDQADLDQKEFAVQGNVRLTEAVSADANLGLASSSYPNNSNLDYKDTRFGLGLRGQAGAKGRWGLRYASTAHDVDLSTSGADNTQSRIEGSLSLKHGNGSSFDIAVHTENYDFDRSNDSRTYSRRGLALSLKNRGLPGNSRTATFEIRQKSYDVADDRNYTEFRAELRGRKLTDGKRKTSRFWGNYRHFKGNGTQGFLDYIEARMDAENVPTAGMFMESSLYGQYFLENNNIKRDALITQFAWMGLVLGENGAFKIGPHIASNTILAVADRPPGQDIGAFEHTSNTVRFGAKASVNIRKSPLRIRGSGRYELTKFYNRDNAPTPSRLELEGEGAYQISPQIDASVRLKMYATGSDDPGAIKTSEFDILFGLIYRIGGPR